MIKITTIQDLERDLVEKLLGEVPYGLRCPHLVEDPEGQPYCMKGLNKGEEISEQRRMVCQSASLQLWCLDIERSSNCIWYNGEPFR